MKCEWKTCSLGSIMTFKNGKKRPETGTNFPVYGGNGVLGYADNWNNGNCVVIGRVGAYCGSVFREKGQCWISDNAISGVSDNNNIDYLYHLLKSLQLNKRHIGTSQPLLTQEILNNIQVTIPSCVAQNKIAAILCSLDDKIELNNKINANLEQQAQTLYKVMFIDNPNVETTEGVLGDIAEITMGQSPSGSSYNEDGNGEVFYQGRAEFGFRFPTRRLFTTEPKRMAEANDVLLSVRAPVGDLNVAYEKCCIGRGLGALHSKDGNSSFLIYTMLSLRPQLNVFNGEGTVFGSINRESLNSIPISIPPKESITKFETIVRPMDDLIRANYDENFRLQVLRDSLLPKLMSGELDVSDIQI